MYDSFLYGNGLTLGILEKVYQIDHKYNIKKDYLDFNKFIDDFFKLEEHRVYRDFEKKFKIDSGIKKNHQQAREYIYQNLDNIKQQGFERWVSESLFRSKEPIPKTALIYVYVLYNYWFELISDNILRLQKVKSDVDSIGQYILNIMKDKTKIYTLNFDAILDEHLKPHHIHGRFMIPLSNMGEVILFKEGADVEYKYLFGPLGLEKLNRLGNINKRQQDYYNLDFIFNTDNLELGYLLIYGISFRESNIYPEGFEYTHPEYKNFTFVKNIDGHIIEKLNLLYTNKRLGKITLAYYSEDDLKHYNNIFSNQKIHQIIDYQHTSEVFPFL